MTNLSLDVISRKQICKQLGVSRDTIRNWISKRNFPEPLSTSGRDPLFNIKEVKEWLDKEAYVTGGVWKNVQIIPCKVGPSFQNITEASK